MGLLDEAIREHLELKRQHGANEEELAQQEAEALGPVSEEDLSAEPRDEMGAPDVEGEAGWPFDRDFSDTWAQQPQEPSFEWGDGTAEEVDVPSFIPAEPSSDPPAGDYAGETPTTSFDALDPAALEDEQLLGTGDPGEVAGEPPQGEALREEVWAPEPPAEEVVGEDALEPEPPAEEVLAEESPPDSPAYDISEEAPLAETGGEALGAHRPPEPPIAPVEEPAEELDRVEGTDAGSGPETEFLPPPAVEPPVAELPAIEPPAHDEGGEPLAEQRSPDDGPSEPEAVQPQPLEPDASEVEPPEPDVSAPRTTPTPAPSEPVAAEPEFDHDPPADEPQLEPQLDHELPAAPVEPEAELDHELPPERELAFEEPVPLAEETHPVGAVAEEPPFEPVPGELDPPEGPLDVEPPLEPASASAIEEPPVGAGDPLEGDPAGPVTEVWSIHSEPGFDEAAEEDEPPPIRLPGEGEVGLSGGPPEGEPSFAAEPVEEEPLLEPLSDDHDPFEDPLAPPLSGPLDEPLDDPHSAADLEPVGTEPEDVPPREPPPAARGFFEETEEHEPLWREERPGADPDFEN